MNISASGHQDLLGGTSNSNDLSLTQNRNTDISLNARDPTQQLRNPLTDSSISHVDQGSVNFTHITATPVIDSTPSGSYVYQVYDAVAVDVTNQYDTNINSYYGDNQSLGGDSYRSMAESTVYSASSVPTTMYTGSVTAPTISSPLSKSGDNSNLNPGNNHSHYNQSSNGNNNVLGQPATQPVDERRTRDFLHRNGWPSGLQTVLLQTLSRIPKRFFICDNSGSMVTNDGNRVVASGSSYR